MFIKIALVPEAMFTQHFSMVTQIDYSTLRPEHAIVHKHKLYLFYRKGLKKHYQTLLKLYFDNENIYRDTTSLPEYVTTVVNQDGENLELGIHQPQLGKYNILNRAIPCICIEWHQDFGLEASYKFLDTVGYNL